MLAKKLFNPNGNDKVEARKMLNGNSTNIFNLNNVKYQVFTRLYKTMLQNYWIPEKISLVDDDLNELTADELKAFKGILSFLIFLDSIQTQNVPHISDYITAPEVNLCLAVQTFQEGLHSQSYQYIVESLLDFKDIDAVYEYWREDSILFDRVKYIAGVFQDFLDNPTDKGFKRVLVANYILEGLYFYNGFIFFYNLSARSKIVGTGQIIKLINKDELIHTTIFSNILKDVLTDADIPMVLDMFKVAYDQEIRWSNHILGNSILGISTKSTEMYTKTLVNRRLKFLNIEPMFSNVTNPYKHLESISDTVGEGSVKSNFFETTVSEYAQSNVVSGWDDF